MDAAGNVQAGSADQYVLLKIARDAAAATGDAATALQAAERLLEQFDEPAAELIGDTSNPCSSSASKRNRSSRPREVVRVAREARRERTGNPALNVRSRRRGGDSVARHARSRPV